MSHLLSALDRRTGRDGLKVSVKRGSNGDVDVFIQRGMVKDGNEVRHSFTLGEEGARRLHERLGEALEGET